MIRTEAEYQLAKKRVLEEKTRLSEYEVRMKETPGFGPAELKRLMDPLRSFTLQLDEEVEAYERILRGSFETIDSLGSVGRLLIAARIYRKLSQRELADRLEVHESQVSRDERNEYRGVTVERAQRILDVMRVKLRVEMIPRTEEGDTMDRAGA